MIDKYANITDKDRRTYAAMTEAMDTMIGNVLATLDKEGMADNTLVLFFSDNGGPLNFGARNTPLRGGKGTAFEGGIRVPTVMRWPGHIKAGAVSNQVMTMMDHFPTLTAAAGIAPGNTLPFDGKNLWHSVTSGKTEKRDDIFFSVETGRTFRCAVHHQEWKLVHEVPVAGGAPTDYLFHIEEDPNETTDLAAKNPDLVKDLAARIETWRKLHPKDGVRETLPPAGYQAPKLWAEAAT